MQPPTSLSAAGDTVFCVAGNLRVDGCNCGLKLLLSYQGTEDEEAQGVEKSLPEVGAFPNKSTPRMF